MFRLYTPPPPPPPPLPVPHRILSCSENSAAATGEGLIKAAALSDTFLPQEDPSAQTHRVGAVPAAHCRRWLANKGSAAQISSVKAWRETFGRSCCEIDQCAAAVGRLLSSLKASVACASRVAILLHGYYFLSSCIRLTNQSLVGAARREEEVSYDLNRSYRRHVSCLSINTTLPKLQDDLLTHQTSPDTSCHMPGQQSVAPASSRTGGLIARLGARKIASLDNRLSRISLI